MACGVDHAHLHVLPLSGPTVSVVESSIECDFPANHTDCLAHVLSTAAQRKARSYLLHGADLDSIRIAFNDRIPSQYVRRLVANVDRRTEWDWRLLNSRAEFLSTHEALNHIVV